MSGTCRSITAIITLVSSVAFCAVWNCGRTADYEILHRFSVDDGTFPVGNLLQDENGNVYGTAVYGGGTGCEETSGCGTVFKLNEPAGTLQVLYRFAGSPDGFGPWGIVADKSGAFYGVTFYGGSDCASGIPGCGTVFRLAPDGSEAVLHSFADEGGDGYFPEGGNLIRQGQDLYGTTVLGGRHCCGTVFKLSGESQYSILFSFPRNKAGSGPEAPVVADKEGNLYGTNTYDDGKSGYRCGSVFKLGPDGSETILYAFKGGKEDGCLPKTGLLLDRSGSLFGTTTLGGGPHDNCGQSGCGTVFRLTPAGQETVLYAFTGGPNGSYPLASLVADRRGNLYGTTYYGGNNGCNGVSGCGVIFRIAPDGSEKTLHTFDGGDDGEGPESSLLKGQDGYFYGATTLGGGSGDCDSGCGTIFRLKP